MRHLLLAASLLLMACPAHTYFNYHCPYQYEHTCDIYYNTYKRVECEKDPESSYCKRLQKIAEDRAEADAEGRCYKDEDCIK